MLKTKMLNGVAVGETFSWPWAKPERLIGKRCMVIGFMPSSYVNRVVFKTENRETGLLPLDVVAGVLAYSVADRPVN